MEVITKETKALQDLARYPYKHYIVYYHCYGHSLTIILEREREREAEGPVHMVTKMVNILRVKLHI